MQFLVAVTIIATCITGQSAPPAQKTAEAKPSDVSSIDDIIGSLYSVISGPAGQKRDWDRMKSLFMPDGRLTATSRRPNGTVGHGSMTVQGYIDRSGPYLEKEGFFEKEISRSTHRFGDIAQVFSTYASRHLPEDKEPFERGINSIQLYSDGKRWWIVSVLWEGESKELKLPTEFLKKNG